MTGLRITFDAKQLGPKIKASMKRHSDAVLQATRVTAQEVAGKIEDEGRADIKGAGNFGARWTDGFEAKVSEGGGRVLVKVTMAVSYWSVFQTGKVIHGRPLLWIPLSFATDAKGINARDYPGQLFRVNRRAGAPLLMAKGGEAKYFGKESVTIPKKFHLLEIIQRIGREMKSMYRANLKRG